jgi:SHS2 domain-containing protein
MIKEMREKKSYEFLEHTADAYIAAYGRNLSEAFENSALATFEVMTDIQKVDPRKEDQIEVEEQDEYALLYSWLEALLVKSEINGMLFSRFKIQRIRRTSKGFRLSARIWGEKFNPSKHLQKVGVKAVTYHRMEIIKELANITVKFILDI